MDPAFHYSRAFVESVRQLADSNPEAWAGIVAARDYLREFGRRAVAPDVRWHIAGSDFADNCGELRWPNPERQDEHPDTALRALFVAHPDNSWYVFTVLGNKAIGQHQGNAWYDVAIPQSDATLRAAIELLGLEPLPTK